MQKLSDETLDNLTIGGLKILQAKNGYRFSIDPVLLNGFIPQVKKARVVDLGTGNAIIPLLLAARGEADSIVGVEIQLDMVDRARRTVALNGLENSIQIIHWDIRALSKKMRAGHADVVTANPPYRMIGAGRTAADNERSMARHEFSGGIKDFVRAASLLLKHGGSFYVVYLAERLSELLADMSLLLLEPKRVRFVHPREREDAKLVLVEGRKGAKPGVAIEAPLVIYKGAGRDYTAEVLAMYGMQGTRDE